MPRLTPRLVAQDLKADDLTCVRGARVVFSGLSLAVAPGTVTFVRGPNGAGKSSLLRLLAGLLRPATGTLRWGDQDIRRDREDHRRRVRYVGHQDAVKPVLSVAENLRHWGALYGARVQAALTADALRTVALDDLADLPARFLSAGQRRRLGLARLAMSPGHLWLLDEPTVSLDAASVVLLESAIRSHVERGGSALIATHGDLDLEPDNVLTLSAAVAADTRDV